MEELAVGKKDMLDPPPLFLFCIRPLFLLSLFFFFFFFLSCASENEEGCSVSIKFQFGLLWQVIVA